MKRFAIVALTASAFGTAALAQSVYVVDPSLGETFELKREVVDTIKEHYDNNVAYSNGNNLPEDVQSELKPGEPIPGDAPVRELPAEVASDLPSSQEGTRWVEIGEHLVEIDPETNRAVVIVYDVVR